MPIIVEPANAYFTVGEFRARYTDIAADDYPDDDVESARLLAETAYEHAIGYALVPRTATERSVTVSGAVLQLPHRFVREITAATDRDGTAVTISNAIYDDSSWVEMTGGWGGGHPLTVAYTHGKDAPDPDDVNAVMILTKHYLVAARSVAGNSSIDPRVTAIENDGSLIRFSVWPREVLDTIARRRIPSVA